MSGIGTTPTDNEDGPRGTSPIVGLIAVLAVTVCLGAIIAVGVGSWSIESGAPMATFDLTVDGDRSAITIEHVAGDPIDVEALSVVITVDGTELANQPPVPFVGANGFDGAPRGPFNAASDSTWEAGERAGVTVAETNAPEIETGNAIAVTLSVDGRPAASLEATAD
ncbi:type IV pilin N-terminal domain-containing protein [Halosolutus gelatinilyticus]|uniref:type IV pilin N-terminal domain-containing protein n=1 Tax=Halosolutus gelatinilyticus TaxID=2931975 RepID=UPI001FF214F6|nr:type IV pilin N-terminal domain-containing protein [Halosolutus gelatinilyticus]